MPSGGTGTVLLGAVSIVGQTDANNTYSTYLPKKDGWIAVGGDGSTTGVGDASTPIYMDANGELKACTSAGGVSQTNNGPITYTGGSNSFSLYWTQTGKVVTMFLVGAPVSGSTS
jgi:hypothetical protein